MKVLLLVVGFFVFVISLTQRESGDTLFVIGGDTKGYLSPCGCTKPMTGGIRRRVTAVRGLIAGRKAIVLENGGLVSGAGRQDELKLETLGEAFRAMQVTAVNLTSTESGLGAGAVESLARLGKATLVTGSADPGSLPIQPYVIKDSFLIGGVSGRASQIANDLRTTSTAIDLAVGNLCRSAEESQLIPILMLEGPRSEAQRLATAFPQLRLIIFQSVGDPEPVATTVGRTTLVTPGDRSKSVVRLTFRDGSFEGYGVTHLSPEYADDPTASRAYDRYLDRVTQAQLIEKLPRLPSAPYVGSASCQSCHSAAFDTWKKTGHAHALRTLEAEKHDRDPDCLRCHVTGLDFESGFVSRPLTPGLSDVGCESCHGAGADHSSDPGKYPMAKLGQAACISCHSKENSPTFNFDEYWSKIKH